MTKIIGKRLNDSLNVDYLRMEGEEPDNGLIFIWDRDIGMADHWDDDVATALLTVLSTMYQDTKVFAVEAVPEPKFKVGHGKAKFENGIHVDIIRVEKGHRSNFYAVAIPFLIDECYLYPV